MSQDTKYVTEDMAAVPTGSAADWKVAFCATEHSTSYEFIWSDTAGSGPIRCARGVNFQSHTTPYK